MSKISFLHIKIIFMEIQVYDTYYVISPLTILEVVIGILAFVGLIFYNIRKRDKRD